MIYSAREFADLRNSDRREDYLRAANEPAALEVWLEIVRDFPEMKVWVAHNKTVPAEILEILAKEPDATVRHAVAMKNKLSPHLMLLLASDIDYSVRQRIVYNKNAGDAVLQKLIDDPCENISLIARSRLFGEKG